VRVRAELARDVRHHLALATRPGSRPSPTRSVIATELRGSAGPRASTNRVHTPAADRPTLLASVQHDLMAEADEIDQLHRRAVLHARALTTLGSRRRAHERLDRELEAADTRLDHIEHVHCGQTDQQPARAHGDNTAEPRRTQGGQTSPSTQDPCFVPGTLTLRSSAKRRVTRIRWCSPGWTWR
jgi:hypothetical protein